MSPKHQRILKALFLEEQTPDQVCLEMGIDRDYLRVLLFRARTELRQALETRNRRRAN
jgi:DNA-directed RNA polymerase specialized sigma24 family protein